MKLQDMLICINCGLLNTTNKLNKAQKNCKDHKMINLYQYLQNASATKIKNVITIINQHEK